MKQGGHPLMHFLSTRLHTDHMTGLDSSELLFALASKSTHMYCSEVTKGLLSGDARFTKLIPLMVCLIILISIPLTESDLRSIVRNPFQLKKKSR